MSRWFRAYDDALDDPKVQHLSGELFKAWFNLMCVTSKNDGQPFDIKEVAFRLRVKQPKATSIISALVDAGLIDLAGGGFYVSHNWDARQFKTDNADPTNADRQKRYRDRHRVTVNTVTPTVTVTPTRAETEQITEKKDAEPSGSHSDEADLFERGKKVLGKDAGGLIAKLLKSKKEIPLARAAIETAATKQNPREYIGRVLAGPARNGPVLMENGQPYPDGII